MHHSAFRAQIKDNNPFFCNWWLQCSNNWPCFKRAGNWYDLWPQRLLESFLESLGKVLSYSTKPPPVKRSSSGYSYGRIHIWCIWVLGDSVIVKISCISESVIVVWNSTCSAPCLLTIMLFGLKRSQEALWSYPVFHSLRMWRIGHFRVPPRFCIKTSAQPLIWKWFFILMQIKLIFTRKVVH